jgi:protein-S-isoprenylcysteine O-methyltransferase Ste14
MDETHPLPPVSAARLACAAAYMALWPVLLLLLAGDARWIEGWILTVWFLALCATVMIWLYRRDPSLLAERFRRIGSGGQKGWDEILVRAVRFGSAVWLVLMPLDARRYGWTPAPPIGLRAFGGAMLMASAFFLFRAFHDNPFLSPLVRIQGERGQRVVSGGVYAHVRHPMYLGAVLMLLGAPLLLGSGLGLAIGVALALLLAYRIAGEERMLVGELPGYAEYRQHVLYRLVPYVW